MSRLSFAVARMAQYYDQIRQSPGSDNQKHSWMTVLTPVAGVTVRLHYGGRINWRLAIGDLRQKKNSF